MRSIALALIPAGLVMALGCNKTIGNTLADTTSHLVLPAIMETGDVGVGCASGEALGSMIAAYGSYSPKAHRASVMTHLSAGMCMDAKVWEAELAGRRALRNGDAEGARDAKAIEQRFHVVAAERYLAAHMALLEAYGVPEPGEECPTKKLKKPEDQLTYLLGLSAGVLAVLHDGGAEGRVGVPLSIPAGVVRGAACVDNDTWWGAPKAMQAAIWALMPNAPGAEDPWATFADSFAKGQAAGVRLPGAFWVQTAASIGRTDIVREGIRAHAAAIKVDGDPTWRMLDVYGTRIVRQESDKIWTGLAGYRTPFGELGTFPDDVVEDSVELSDDLFDDILAE